MKKTEVPLENNSTLNGQKKVMYAVSEKGEFSRVNYGSSVEEFATITAVEEYQNLQEECLEEIKQNIASPIKYFMYKNRMDISTLSSVVGMFSFRVKRHLQMKYFKNLNDKIVQKYANAFGVNIEEIKEFTHVK
ncbi:MAG: hypothetical protein WC141_00295 [Arcobacteraceae bacterium]